MPTGYTADVLDKNISFPQFVWDCARAFGALIHMRDDGHGARIVKPEPSSYHQEALADATAELPKLKRMTDAEAEAIQQAAIEKALQEQRESKERTARAAQRLTTMIAKVEAWQPPTKDHQGLKAFMLEQLRSTLEFDGTFHDWPIPVPKPAAEYRDARIKSCLEDIEYHAKHLREDQEREAGRSTWIDQLQDSVPYPGGRI